MQDAASSTRIGQQVSPINAQHKPVYSQHGFSHNPFCPQFFVPPDSHAKRPDVLQYAQHNLRQFYDSPDKWLPSLRDTRASTRQERTEARERDAAVLGVLLQYTELASLRVGIPNADGVFLPLTMKYLAMKLGWRTPADDLEDKARIAAGLTPRHRGVKRVYRAIANFKRAGYMTVHARFEKTMEGEQDYTGLPAVRRIDPKLFRELGIKRERLELRRKEAGKRLRKKYAEYSKKMFDNKIAAMLEAQATKSSAGSRRGVPPRAGLRDSKQLLAANLGALTAISGTVDNSDFASTYPALATLKTLLPDKPT